MRAPSGARPHRAAAYVRAPNKIHEDTLRRRAASAYLRLPGTVDAQAHAMGLHHTALVRRRQGHAGLSTLLVEIDALERAGVDTSSLADAMLDTQLDARAARADALDVRALSHEETALDGAEDCAQLDWHDGRPGAAERWCEALVRSVAAQTRLVLALRREGAGR